MSQPLNGVTGVADGPAWQALFRLLGHHGCAADVRQAMRAVVDLAVAAVEPAVTATVRLTGRVVEDDAAALVIGTADLPPALESALTGGPVATALAHGSAIVLDETTDDGRWPQLADAAHQAGVGPIVVVALASPHAVVGTLCVVGPVGGTFAPPDLQTVTLLGRHATAAVLAWRQAANSRQAIESRDIIGQAKGILMERLHLTADEAFALLVQESQATQRKLRSVAEDLALTGSVPDVAR